MNRRALHRRHPGPLLGRLPGMSFGRYPGMPFGRHPGMPLGRHPGMFLGRGPNGPGKTTGSRPRSRPGRRLNGGIRIFLIFLNVVFNSPVSARAVDGGHSTAAFLQFPGDARAAGMGEAVSADADGVAGMWSNPATIARYRSASLSLMHTMYVEDVRFNTAALAVPFGNGHAFGLGGSYLSAGGVDGFDNTGAPAPNYSPKDLSVRMAYARLFGRTSLGLAAAYVRSTIQNSAAALTFSGGVHHELGPILLSLAGENIGGSLTYGSEASPLPHRVRTGVSFLLLPGFKVNSDFFKPTNGAGWAALGAEYALNLIDMGTVALRTGYNTKTAGITDAPGVSVGMGATWNGIDVNYAWVPFGDLGQTHRLSFNLHGLEPISDSEPRDDMLSSLRVWRGERLAANEDKAHSKRLYTGNLPIYPWKSKSGKRHSSNKVMDLLAKDALCSLKVAHALITKTKGTVAMKPDKQQKWIRPKAGQYLFQGDRLKTDKEATAHLVFANGVRAEISPETTVRLEETSDVCDKSIVTVMEGEIYALVDQGKEMEVKTPDGDAYFSGSEGRVNVENGKVVVQTGKGSAQFQTGKVITALPENHVLTKEREVSPLVRQANEWLARRDVTTAESAGIPGRWDPDYAYKLEQEISKLLETSGLSFSEYVRDTNLRDDLQISVNALKLKQREIETQMSEFQRDAAQFKSMMAELKSFPAGESPAAKLLRKTNFKQADTALLKAMVSMNSLEKELKSLIVAVRAKQEMLASTPIVRMLNITAQESSIPFDSSQALLDRRGERTLGVIAEAVLRMRPYRVVIEGHTDKIGSAKANNRLSLGRAEAVAAYLREKTGLPRETFKTKGMGSSIPLVDEDTPAAYSKNRRVEIWFEMRGL